MKYFVELESVGNPDFGQNPNQPLWGCQPNEKRQVSSIQEASDACVKFIEDNELGAGNWAGGKTTDERGVTVATISYNGIAWTPALNWEDKKPLEKDHVCLCNNCGSRLIDQNPKDDTKVYLEGNEKEMVQLEDEGGVHWACPECKTDNYLQDIL